MAVQFILGRSGTGKTHYCIRSVVDALTGPGTQPLILLVPEQATYQAEQAILSDERIAGYNRLYVLSFDRLQFLLLGKKVARRGLSRTGRQMIIHRILRDNRDKLKLFGSSADRPGLAQQIGQTISELHAYTKTPEDIEQLLRDLEKGGNNELALLKFTDIGLVLKEYLGFIAGRFADPDRQLMLARQAVADAEFTKGSRLWVDGFAGFTAAELAILIELLKTAKDSQIALCLDPRRIDLEHPDKDIDPTGLFYPTEQTYAVLVEAIRQAGIPLKKPIIFRNPARFSARAELAHIERCASGNVDHKMPAGDAVRLVLAPNERAEVNFVAREILRLVREQDYRYRDIAVIVSDIEHYQHYIRACFEDYAIPFFIDRRRPLSRHPVVQLVCSALQTVLGGFSNSDIFAYLKTDLVGVDRFEVDLLENYCLAFGITSADWQDSARWSFAGPQNSGFDEERINRTREKVVGPLNRLRERLCPGGDWQASIEVGQFIKAIFELLEELGVSGSLTAWVEHARLAGDNAAVDEHQQFYARFVEVFDELAEVFAGSAMTAEQYAAILGSAFSELTLALIPPMLDQVLVGSIERSRHPDLKAVFLIGATQKLFPVPVVSDDILSDDDRRAAESAGFALGPGVEKNLCSRRYLAYIAFTRPSQLLCVTYPAMDGKGAAQPRSGFVGELESYFEDLVEESIAGQRTEISSVYSRYELMDLLCATLGRDAPSCGDQDRAKLGRLLGGLCGAPQLEDLGRAVLAALDYNNQAELADEVIEQLFTGRFETSATRLGTFAACPYKHFARYVLELAEREEFKFEPLDLGNFYHKVLDAWLASLNPQGRPFSAIPDEQIVGALQEQVNKLLAEDGFISHFARHSRHNAFIISEAAEALEDCVRAVARMVRAGSFEPQLSEVSFGRVREARRSLGDYELALPNGRVLALGGKIDRVDVAEIAGRKIAIIFDYKRRNKSFNWADFYHGLDMQLPVYILAVRNSSVGGEGLNAVGAFYMPVESKALSAGASKPSERADRFRHKARGIFNGEFYQALDNSNTNEFYNFHVDKKGNQYSKEATSAALRPEEFQDLLQFTKEKIRRLGIEILSGRIEARPYRIPGRCPCTRCEYKPVCRFDWQINEYNPLESLNKSEVLGKIGQADG